MFHISNIYVKKLYLCYSYNVNWKPQRLSELTPIVFNPGLTYLGSETSNL